MNVKFRSLRFPPLSLSARIMCHSWLRRKWPLIHFHDDPSINSPPLKVTCYHLQMSRMISLFHLLSLSLFILLDICCLFFPPSLPTQGELQIVQLMVKGESVRKFNYHCALVQLLARSLAYFILRFFLSRFLSLFFSSLCILLLS